MERGTLTLAVTLAVATALLAGAPPAEAKDPFEAMAVQRPAASAAAPDVAFVTADGRAARLETLRGKVVLLGFFTTT